MDKSPKSAQEHDLGDVPAVFAMESITDTEDMPRTVYSETEEVKASP